MPFIQNRSWDDIKHGWHKNPGDNSVLIQIADPASFFPDPQHKFKIIHQFEFLDVEDDHPFPDDVMTIRSAVFEVFEGEDFMNEAGYIKNVKCVCLLNDVIVAFTIREWKSWFSRKVTYELSVKLHSFMTGRPYGNKMFDTYEEALEFGKKFIKDRFPVVDNQNE